MSKWSCPPLLSTTTCTYYMSFEKHIHFLVLSVDHFISSSVSPADCQLCKQGGPGHGSAAAVPGHPRVHGAQQSGSLPQGGARDHHWTAHPTSSRVSGSLNCVYEHELDWFIFVQTISVSYTVINAFQTTWEGGHELFYLLFSNFRTDQDIQTYTIAVINALFLKAPEEKRQVRLWCAHTALSPCNVSWCSEFYVLRSHVITSAFLYRVLCVYICV